MTTGLMLCSISIVISSYNILAVFIHKWPILPLYITIPVLIMAITGLVMIVRSVD